MNETRIASAGRREPYVSGSYRSIFAPVPSESLRTDHNYLTIVLFTDGEKPLEVHGPAMRMGPVDAVANKIALREIIDFSLLSVYFCIGIFHTLLFLRKRSRHYLHFGLFAILLALYLVFFTRTKDILFGDSIELRIKLEFISLFALGPFFLEFVSQFLRNKTSRVAVSLGTIYLILSLVVCFSNSFRSQRFCVMLWQFTALPGMCYVVFYVAMLAIRGNRDARYLLLGIAFLMIGGIHDILISLGVFHGQNIATYSFIPFVPTIAWILASDLVRKFMETEVLSKNLEITVESQTKELANSTQYTQRLEGDFRRAEADLDRLAEIITGKEVFRESMSERALVYSSEAMKRVIEEAGQVVKLNRPVLITGETGTGKELVARYIHESDNPTEPFVAINCAAIPATLWEDELFGHSRGAFTDAGATRTGRLQEAGTGTLFFDEIGETPLEMQSKLLRVLQERTFYAVGSDQLRKIECRFIFATNRDLSEEVKHGRFREDLFYRINVFNIQLPPLRDRREDIPWIAQHYAERLSEELSIPLAHFSEEAMRAMMLHDWPGNIRELENTLVRILVGGATEISAEQLPPHLSLLKKESVAVPFTGDFEGMTREYARSLIRSALVRARGNKSAAARLLGMKRSRLNYQIRELGLA